MRPSSSQLFCVRHALTFCFAREPRRLIFHILAITLTLEALADSRLWPFHSDRAFPLQPLHLPLLSRSSLCSTPRMNSPPISIHLSIKFVVRTLESDQEIAKRALHFGNGVFNSLASLKRGDSVDQLVEERVDGLH